MTPTLFQGIAVHRYRVTITYRLKPHKSQHNMQLKATHKVCTEKKKRNISTITKCYVIYKLKYTACIKNLIIFCFTMP